MNPLLLELIRQAMRWLGVWLMTVGIPESLAGLTTNEDIILGIAGFVMYAVSDTGWAVSFYRRARIWWMR